MRAYKQGAATRFQSLRNKNGCPTPHYCSAEVVPRSQTHARRD
jgi:hypothetical protein